MNRRAIPSQPNAKRLSRVEDVEELLAGNTGDGLLDRALGLALLSEELLSSEGLGVRVESEEDGLVAERVLLLGEGSCSVGQSLCQLIKGDKRTLLGGRAGGSDDGLDLVRSDESGDVGRGDLGLGEAVKKSVGSLRFFSK